MTPDTGIFNFAAKISSFGQRAQNIAAKIAGLSERRKEFALGAAEGNKASLKAIEELDTERDALRKEHETLTAAMSEAERLKREQEAETARAERERRAKEARTIADQVVAVNSEIDAAMNMLREMFERRADLLRQLSNKSYYSSTLILKLLQKFGPTAAARAAGLQNHIAIDHVPLQHVRSLVENNKGLAGQRLPIADATDE